MSSDELQTATKGEEDPLPEIPTHFETVGGNGHFESGEVYWEGFAEEYEQSADLSVGTMSGKVNVGAGIHGEDLNLGVLANLEPDEARSVAAAIQKAADIAEEYGEFTGEEADSRSFLNKLLGGDDDRR